MEKKINKRQQRAHETKNKIYETAERLIRQYGLENVSIDSIVEASGVSKGSFYVHFESKDAILAEIVNDYTNKADLDYKSFMLTLSGNESIFDILIHLVGEISDFIENSIGLDNMRALYRAHLSKTVDTTSAMSYNREIYKLFSEVLERGVKQGEVREDIPIDLIAKHLIISLRGVIFEWCVRYPDFNLKEQVLVHSKLLLQGLKKETFQ